MNSQKYHTIWIWHHNRLLVFYAQHQSQWINNENCLRNALAAYVLLLWKFLCEVKCENEKIYTSIFLCVCIFSKVIGQWLECKDFKLRKGSSIVWLLTISFVSHSWSEVYFECMTVMFVFFSYELKLRILVNAVNTWAWQISLFFSICAKFTIQTNNSQSFDLNWIFRLSIVINQERDLFCCYPNVKLILPGLLCHIFLAKIWKDVAHGYFFFQHTSFHRWASIHEHFLISIIRIRSTVTCCQSHAIADDKKTKP